MRKWEKKRSQSYGDDGRRILSLVAYWEDLTALIRSKGLYEINEIFRQFVDFSEAWFPYKEISLSNKEIDILHSEEVGKAGQ